MKRHLPKIILFFIACCILIITVVVVKHLSAAQANLPIPTKKEQAPSPDVSVIKVVAGSYASEVKAYGAAKPHFDITLTAQVAGQIDSISDQFETGKRLKKNTIMARLENSEYQAAVESARQALSSAKVSLLEEERQGLQALSEWKSSGLEGEPDSDLVLRKPQLAAAKATVKQAEASLKAAEKDLSQSAIKAPFDALVINRAVSPGGYVQTGSEVATLYSTDRVEISVALSAQEWNNLPSLAILNSGKWPVEIESVEDHHIWQGRVLRAEQNLNVETRQRSLIIAVDEPLDLEPALFPGTFVSAHITGRNVAGVWKLPNSALSQRGEVWYVAADNTLQKFSASPLFSSSGYIYIQPPEPLNNTPVMILVSPLNSYLEGMAVNPVEVAL
ncbi:MAG TPA: efflux RND transporter periplasmic adaptor subunit [Methylophaga aminisulfidivorans]|uniref:efflux RND transporter periplasmic adaptor subunit n=1 Tax=Methylophaga TaxID=40222 RepID=UPI00176538A6|nr:MULTISPECIES: efflux RND transporter periplasmic adaptor subunit [Methylophaga]HIC48178.1 efflux RND transporter periplasmic adaptor subunit [Methylophaga sp.]HIM40714.1 efflux RND transporter periplasmic adaptor subunit [Methylophaga aminisulfidivorans]